MSKQEIIIKCIFCKQNSPLGHLTSNTHYLSPPLRNLCLQELWEINLKGTVAVVCDYHKDVTLFLLVFQSKSTHYSSLQSSKVLENCQKGSTL